MAKDDGFGVVIAHTSDVECALLAFGGFAYCAHFFFLFLLARFLRVDLLLLRRFKSQSIFRYDNANDLNSFLLTI